MTRLHHTDYYLTIRKAWENSASMLYYIKPPIEMYESAHNSCRQYDVKLSRIRIGHTRLTHGHLMSKKKQQPICGNAAHENQRLTIKHCLQDCPQWKNSRKKYNIQGVIRTLLGRDFEVKITFLNRTWMFKEI